MPFRTLTALGSLILVLHLPGAASGSASASAHATLYTRSGLTVAVPSGWRLLHRADGHCLNPTERLAVAGRGALVMLQERLAPELRYFTPRPVHFHLQGRPRPMECCAPLGRPGWFASFRQGSRAFYLYVYLGQPGTRAEALAILDSLRVAPS